MTAEPILQPGMRLYQVVYWSSSGRRMEQVTIGRVDRVTVKARRYTNYRIRIDAVGKDWFLTRLEAIDNSIKINKAAYRKIKPKNRIPENYTKEMKSLERWRRNTAARAARPRSGAKEESNGNRD